MRNTEKIPVPASRKWAEIRQRFLPLIIFLVVGLTAWQLWHQRVDRAVMTGQVQGDRIEITATEAGYLTDLNVQDFEQVRTGQKIGSIITTDPQILESQLAVINAEIDLIRHSMNPIAGIQRNQLNLYDLQMDLMENQIALSSNRIQKNQLRRDLERYEELYSREIVTDEEVEQLRTELDRTRSEIAYAEEMVETMESRLASYNMPDYGTNSDDTRNAVAAAIRVQEEQLKLIEAELSPKDLHAPMDGVISKIHHSSGAHLQSNDPIATIVSGEPGYILGYLQHPVDQHPHIGQEVDIITQGRRNVVGKAVIVEIGNHYERIEDQFMTTPNNPTPLGLPVKINITSDIELLPGELVDLAF